MGSKVYHGRRCRRPFARIAGRGGSIAASLLFACNGGRGRRPGYSPSNHDGIDLGANRFDFFGYQSRSHLVPVGAPVVLIDLNPLNHHPPLCLPPGMPRNKHSPGALEGTWKSLRQSHRKCKKAGVRRIHGVRRSSPVHRADQSGSLTALLGT